MRYWADFILFPLFIAIVATVVVTWGAASAILAILGILAFSYAEYWVHRTVLHRLFWHGKHERHHRIPEEHVEFQPWWMPLALFMILFVFTVPAFWVGAATGYLWFISWHHMLHHAKRERLPGWVQRYATWHDRHHTNWRCNFGITLPVWDSLHGTSRGSWF